MKIQLLSFDTKANIFKIKHLETNKELQVKKGMKDTLNPFYSLEGFILIDTDIQLRTLFNCYKIRWMSREQLDKFSAQIGASDLEVKYKKILQEEIEKRNNRLNYLEVMAVNSDYDVDDERVEA